MKTTATHFKTNSTDCKGGIAIKYRLTALIAVLFFFSWASFIHYAIELDAQPYDTPTPQVEAPKIEAPQTQTFIATAYCYGTVTATGTTPQVGRTVASDTSILPYGTELVIDGVGGYIVEDCGNYWSEDMSADGYYTHIRGNRIDLFVEDYETAIAFGRREVQVQIKEESE